MTEAQQLYQLYRTDDFREEFGVVRLEHWPEGIVLWVGGQIRWKSWCDPEFWMVRPKTDG